MKSCGLTVALLLLVIPSMIWRGFVFSVLWSWFMVTSFSLPELGVAAAIGVAVVAGMLTANTNDGNDDGNDDGNKRKPTEIFVSALVRMLVVPAVSLGFGWIVKGFM